jgi:hypothetical protein
MDRSCVLYRWIDRVLNRCDKVPDALTSRAEITNKQTKTAVCKARCDPDNAMTVLPERPSISCACSLALFALESYKQQHFVRCVCVCVCVLAWLALRAFQSGNVASVHLSENLFGDLKLGSRCSWSAAVTAMSSTRVAVVGIVSVNDGVLVGVGTQTREEFGERGRHGC